MEQSEAMKAYADLKKMEAIAHLESLFPAFGSNDSKQLVDTIAYLKKAFDIEE
jgi:hypothetical protein